MRIVTSAFPLSLLLSLAATVAAAPVDFRREIQPVLSEHCFHCHGPDEAARKGGLRLDVREAALVGGESGEAAVVPGEPNQSLLLTRILSHDPDEIMPPPREKKPMSPEAIEVLRRWISEGAEYAEHWAFVAPLRPPVPERSESKTPPSHPIDAFVRQRLAQEGLKPAPPAPASALARRLYLDLIGLPPSPADVKAFADAAAVDRVQAVTDLVERLLAQPAFGEKWARHWLDLARYADSNGYEKDVPREQWAWRDWVIKAFNDDLPYDQFIITQVAGDMKPGATQDDWVATGYLANNMINEEGAIVAEQFRVDGMFDRMDALGKGVLGLSLQCAQCHTHKFDPITQEEYFGLYAFVNDAFDAQSWVYRDEQQRQLHTLQAAQAALDEKARQMVPDWATRLAAWEENARRELAAMAWTLQPIKDSGAVSGLNHPSPLADGSMMILGHRTMGDTVYFIGDAALPTATGLRLEILTHGDLPFNGPGRSEDGTWALSELTVEFRPPGTEGWQKISLTRPSADYSNPEGEIDPAWRTGADKDKPRRHGPVAFAIDGDAATAWRADRGPGRRNASSVGVFSFAEPVRFPTGTEIKISLLNNMAGGGSSGAKNNMIGRIRFSLTVAPEPHAGSIEADVLALLAVPADKRSAEEQTRVFRAWMAAESAVAPLVAKRAALWEEYPQAPTSVLHLAQRPPANHRPTQLLERGVWNQPKHEVRPHVPAVLHDLPEDRPPDRLAFARWLVDRRSPLAARVMVNRVWQTVFGLGLVETSEDFGTRAAPPSHPELLDWLAVEFMESGWSLKRLLRLITTSATYQQDAHADEEARERDPANRLLARGPRFRLEAEVVRDAALAISGLLTQKVGGPSIFPPVPENLLSHSFASVDYWQVAEGPERYRRALYVFRRRSMPDPVLASFDAPNADTACARRPRSNTPLAALAGLNEPVFVEAARSLALRVLREGGDDDASRVDYTFRLCVARQPSAAERAAVLALLQDRRRALAEGWLNPHEIATGQLAQRATLPPGATPQDAAAWTIAARVLLNLDETLSK